MVVVLAEYGDTSYRLPLGWVSACELVPMHPKTLKLDSDSDRYENSDGQKKNSVT